MTTRQKKSLTLSNAQHVDAIVKLDKQIKELQRQCDAHKQILLEWAKKNPDKNKIHGTHFVISVLRMVKHVLDTQRLKEDFGSKLDPYYNEQYVTTLRIGHC